MNYSLHISHLLRILHRPIQLPFVISIDLYLVLSKLAAHALAPLLEQDAQRHQHQVL